MASEKNCWEFNKCDREPGGTSARELGICPMRLLKKDYMLSTEVRTPGEHVGLLPVLFAKRKSEEHMQKSMPPASNVISTILYSR